MVRDRGGVLVFALSLAAALTAQQPPAPSKPATNDLRLVGRIVSVVHEGVPAAEVWATDLAGKVLGRTVADGDGYYQLPRLPNGTLRLHAQAPGQVPAQIDFEAHGRTAAVTVPLEDGVPLQGTVVAADGKPVAGVEVVVMPLLELFPPFAWHGEVVTDANGAWSLPAVPMRRLLLRVFAPGHALAEVQVERGTVAVPVRLIADPAPPRRVQLKNWPVGGNVVVRVEPSAVERGLRLPRSLREAAVGADGTAWLWPLARGHEVRVAAPGFRTLPVAALCAAGTTKDLEFELIALGADQVAPNTAMHGRVQDALGQPLPGIAVLGRSQGSIAAPVVTAADGTFQLQMPARAGVLCEFGIASDEWCLGDLRAKLELDGRCWLTVSTDAERQIVLHSIRSGSVQGVLRDSNGTPLAAAAVQLQLRRPGSPPAMVAGATDPSGRLHLSGLLPGPYLLTSAGHGQVPASVEVTVPAGGVVEPGPLPFVPQGEIRGVVRDAAGAVVGGAVLGTLLDRKRVPPAFRRQMLAQVRDGVVLTDRRGCFRVPGVAAGDWVLSTREETELGKPADDTQRFTVGAGEVVTLEVRR